MIIARRRGRLLVLLGGVLALVVLAGCTSSQGSSDGSASDPSASGGEVVRMWIAPELAECVGVGPMECMQVAYEQDGETQLFYDQIEGFEYVEGTSYVVDVQVSDVADPPADASSKRYTLVAVVSETPA